MRITKMRTNGERERSANEVRKAKGGSVSQLSLGIGYVKLSGKLNDWEADRKITQ